MDDLRVVLQVVKEHHFFEKYNKSHFWLRSVVFPSHIKSSKGIEFDLKKIDVLKNFIRPLTPTDIRSFLGLVGYYRSFLDGFY